MRNTRLLLACGTIMSVMTAGALAQNEQPSKPTQPIPDRPVIEPVFPTTPSKTTTSTSAPDILRQMEGVWRVEIQCNHDHWNKDGMNTPNRMSQPNSQPNPRPVDPSRPNDPLKPTDQDRTNPTQPTDPSKPADPNNPDKIQDPFKRNQPGVNSGELKQYVGYAETKLILGGNVLQEKIIIPDMLATGSGKTPGRIDGSPTTVPSSADSNMFRGLGLISFDPGSQQYHCVFVDSRSGQMHHHTGSYNESEKKLVFDAGSSSEPGKPGMEHKNVRVVVDMISPTQHRVTMYANDATGRSPTIPPTPNTPARENTRTTTDDEGSVIYRATYTKASAEDAPKFRRLLQEPGMSMLDRDNLRDRDTNRDNPNRDNPGNRDNERNRDDR